MDYPRSENSQQIASAFRLNPAGGIPPPPSQVQLPQQPQFGGVPPALTGFKGFIAGRSATTWALLATFIIETVLYFMYEPNENFRTATGIIIPAIIFAFLYFLNESAYGIVSFIPPAILKTALLVIVFAHGWFHLLDFIAKKTKR